MISPNVMEYDDSLKQKILRIVIGGESKGGIDGLRYVYGECNKGDVLFPVSFIDDGDECGYLNIEQDYYDTHKEWCDTFIEEIIKSTSNKRIFLYGEELITKRNLKAIKENNKIERYGIRTGLEVLAQSKELLDVESFDFSSYRRPDCLTESYFINQKVNISRRLTKEELTILRDLFIKYPQEEIVISRTARDQIDEIMEVVNAKKVTVEERFWNNGTSATALARICQENNIHYGNLLDNLLDISIKCLEEKYPNIIEKYDNVFFDLRLMHDEVTVKAKDINEKSKIMKLIVNEVDSLELSPLEKYMYLYNIVKLYKEYNEEDKTKLDSAFLSRHTIFTLFNEYMVCCGYARFLTDLVTELDDPNLKVAPYSCDFPKGGAIGHERCIVNIRDEKYGVFGMYISDPTWDSFKTQKNGKYIDYYNHFLMTKQESDKLKTGDGLLSDPTDIIFGDGENFNGSFDFVQDETKTILEKLRFTPSSCQGEKYIFSECLDIKQKPVSRETIINAMNVIYSKIFFDKHAERPVAHFAHSIWNKIWFNASSDAEALANQSRYEYYLRGRSIFGEDPSNELPSKKR